MGCGAVVVREREARCWEDGRLRGARRPALLRPPAPTLSGASHAALRRPAARLHITFALPMSPEVPNLTASLVTLISTAQGRQQQKQKRMENSTTRGVGASQCMRRCSATACCAHGKTPAGGSHGNGTRTRCTLAACSLHARCDSGAGLGRAAPLLVAPCARTRVADGGQVLDYPLELAAGQLHRGVVLSLRNAQVLAARGRQAGRGAPAG